MITIKLAARLNSFEVGAEKYCSSTDSKAATFDLIARAATVPGLNAVDLNDPDHLEGYPEAEMDDHLTAAGVARDGCAMRCYTDPGFKVAAFTDPTRL